VKFYKYHALGNDYLVLNPADFPAQADSACKLRDGPAGNDRTPSKWGAAPPSEAEVRLLCHRHYGLGSDGILWGPVETLDNVADAVGDRAKQDNAAQPRQNGSPRMLRIYNPDGSEAEKSGNGLRIFARYLAEHGLVQGDTFTLQTVGGPARVEIIDRAAWRLCIGMGRATFASAEIPVAGPSRDVLGEALDLGGDRHFSFCAASVGNPHCVVPLPEISEELARRYGPEIETHPLFPNRINVQFMQVIDRANIRIEIWERGAGYTLASGTSSSAAAAVAHRLGLVDSQVTVHMPGGTLEINIAPDWEITLTGTVTKVSEGQLSPDLFSFLDRV